MKDIIKKFESFEESPEDIELRKIERWVKTSGNVGTAHNDWDWDGTTLTISKDDGDETYSKQDLVDAGVFESASTSDNNNMIEDMKLIIKTLHINPSIQTKGKAILKYLQKNNSLNGQGYDEEYDVKSESIKVIRGEIKKLRRYYGFREIEKFINNLFSELRNESNSMNEQDIEDNLKK